MSTVRTEGQRRLKGIVERGTTQREIARRLGVTEGPVSMWLSGKNVPDGPNVGKLQDEFGIPAPTWSRKPRRNGHSKAA